LHENFGLPASIQMSDTSPTFVDLCLSGQAVAEDVDDYVSRWHDETDPRPLHTFLGFTEDEYAIWVERPEALKFIVFARMKSLSLGEALQLAKTNGNGVSMSANGSAADEVGKLLDWFIQTGRVRTAR
jgi:hypothetical protein